MTAHLPKEELLSRGREIEGELIEFRRDLHRYPELSFQETRTAAKVADALRALGLEVRTGVGGHGVVADLTGAKPGRTVALRADMDALPITEETGLPFASQNPGVMHACGHDAHTTILLGAARILSGMKDRLAGKVRFLFQSAEEIVAGAKAMVEDGALEGVDEIYGLHNWPTMPAGKVGTRSGPLMGSSDQLEVKIEGFGGHGAMPDRCIDPVVAAAAVVMGLQSAVSREISPFAPTVVTIGKMRAGEVSNVIPNFAELSGTIRTFWPEVRDRLPEKLTRIVKDIAAGYRCRAEVEYIHQVPVLINEAKCTAYLEEAVDALIGPENRLEAEVTLGSEDFAVFLEHVPGSFFWLGSGPTENADKAYGLHHPKFNLNEDCLALGASLLAAVAFKRCAES